MQQKPTSNHGRAWRAQCTRNQYKWRNVRIAVKRRNRGGKTAGWFHHAEFVEIAAGTHLTSILRKSFVNVSVLLEKTIVPEAHLTRATSGQK